MSAIDDIEAAIRRQREENAAAIQVHRSDSKALADMTSKLTAALNGQVNDVDIVRLAAEINDAAQELHNGLAATHTTTADVQTANAGTSVVQGGAATGPDVVSASSPGTVVPQTDIPNSAVPGTLGGGAMPAQAVTDSETAEKAPSEPDVPSVADTPDVGDAGRKGGKKG